MGEVFHYMECDKCGTLQLTDHIPDIGKYYPTNYYSLTQKKEEKNENIFLRIWHEFFSACYVNLGLQNIHFGGKTENNYEHLNYLIPIKPKRTARILDVGCGSGKWLDLLWESGYHNISGVDKFADSKYSDNPWTLLTGEVFDLHNEKYDVITLHHSFEHMDHPLETLQTVHDMLTDQGTLVIRIPVMGKKVWRDYGTNWYQIDAPRHLNLFTEKSIHYLCKKAGLKVVKTVFDSNESQFRVSEGYRDTKLSLGEINRKHHLHLEQYTKMAQEANQHRDGDQAAFYIRKR